MSGIEDRIAEVIDAHSWSYRCRCGYDRWLDYPSHVAAAVVAELGLAEEDQFVSAFGQGDTIERRWVTQWEKAE